MMTTEIYVLILAGLLQVVQYGLFAIPANLELGVARTLSPRDTPIDPAKELNPTTARLGRALQNHFEALILFTAAVVAVSLAEKNSTFTALCAHAYLIARIAYIPAYASGAQPWRSLIWSVGFFATLLMLIAALM